MKLLAELSLYLMIDYIVINMLVKRINKVGLDLFLSYAGLSGHLLYCHHNRRDASAEKSSL